MEFKKFEDFESEAAQYKKILLDYKRNKKPFVDPSFHPALHIREYKITIDDSPKNWKRVDEMYNSPLFDRNAIASDFVQQGEIGDCYFLAALSRIAKQPELVPSLFERDIPNQILGREKDSINIKCGAVVIYFNCFGRKTPVLIDTLLPTKNGGLRFSHPLDHSKSAWFCLVEKAYAKLHGSYSSIIIGFITNAIYSIYGYYPKNKYLKELSTSEKVAKMPLFERMMKYQSQGAVIGVSIKEKCLLQGVTKQEVQSKGLVFDHCYLVSKIREHEGKKFFCLRNPWGKFEWNGDYSDNSPKWTPELKEGLNWKNMDDGTFWMSDVDFFRYFTDVEISRPLRPEWYSRSYSVQLIPGDHDGYDMMNSRSKISERKNFAFRITEPIKECRFHIMVEKRHNLYDESKNFIYNPPNYIVILCHCNGRKISPEVLRNSYRNTMTSNNTLMCFSSKVKGNDDIVTIAIHRLHKCPFAEDCYVHVFCEKDFILYDIDFPDELIPEDINNGIVFDNYSEKHPKVALPLKLKRIKNKDVITFSSMTGKDFEPLKEELMQIYKEEENKIKIENQVLKPENLTLSSSCKCFFVVSNLSCFGLVNKTNTNVGVRFIINNESIYQTKLVGPNVNPKFGDLLIPINDYKKDDCVICIICGNNQQNIFNFCNPLKYDLSIMEINPLKNYQITVPLTAFDGSKIGFLSFGAKLCNEKDINSLSLPQVNQTNIANDFILEFTVVEATLINANKQAYICCYFSSNEANKFAINVNQKVAFKIGNPNDESIFFGFIDENGNYMSSRTQFKLAQIGLNSSSMMNTQMSCNGVSAHLKILFTLKK